MRTTTVTGRRDGGVCEDRKRKIRERKRAGKRERKGGPAACLPVTSATAAVGEFLRKIVQTQKLKTLGLFLKTYLLLILFGT